MMTPGQQWQRRRHDTADHPAQLGLLAYWRAAAYHQVRTGSPPQVMELSVEGLFFHLVAAAGPTAARVTGFSAVVIAAFVVYIGIAMVVVLRTDDVRKSEIRYRVFRDLLGLFRRGRR